jgi:hypothetical protein
LRFNVRTKLELFASGINDGNQGALGFLSFEKIAFDQFFDISRMLMLYSDKRISGELEVYSRKIFQ